MSASSELQAVFFDLDGTLVDTEMAAARVIQATFRSWNLEIDPKDAEFLTGRTWASAFELMFKKYEIPLPRPEAERLMLDSYADALKQDLPVVPGGAQAVRALCAKYPLALVSGSNRREILWALGQLQILDCFKCVLGAEDYPRSKPAPDGYQMAMQILSVEPGRTMIFEDSAPGIDSALASGARVVAITGTNHFGQNNKKAHHHIPDLTGVDAAWALKIWPKLLSSQR